jgi:hypothetical protein
VTDESGRIALADGMTYALSDLAPGLYRLHAAAAGYAFDTDIEVTLADGDVEGQNFVGRLTGHGIGPYSISGQVTDGHERPLPFALATLHDAGTGVLLAASVSDAAGQYQFGSVRTGAEVVVRVTLENHSGGVVRFRIGYGGDCATAFAPLTTGDAVCAESPPLQAGQDIRKDISWTSLSLRAPGGVPKDRLDDLAAVYFHTWQAIDLALQHSFPLDYGPVSVYAFAHGDACASTARWDGSTAVPAAVRPPVIVIGEGQSSYESPDRPVNREWHEIGHQVMADLFGNALPVGNRPQYQGGPDGASTSGSWVEGWAEFWAMAVARQANPSTTPGTYAVRGIPIPLEADLFSRPWGWQYPAVDPVYSLGEEFAIAGMLWDLYDASAAPGEQERVSLALEQLRAILADGRTSYPYDLQSAYSALTWQPEQYGYTVKEIDDIFTAHGLFDDANGNHQWDPGEQMGRLSTADNPERRNVPAMPGAYLAYTVVDKAKQAVAVTTFSVSVAVASPHQGYSYSFEAHADPAAPGLLYLMVPPADAPAEVTVKPVLEGYSVVKPLTFTTEIFWRQMSAKPVKSFSTASFVMEPVPTQPLQVVSWLLSRVFSTPLAIGLGIGGAILMLVAGYFVGELLSRAFGKRR